MCQPDPSNPEGTNFRTTEQGSIGLDFVPLDKDLWVTGAKRVIVNCCDKGAVSLQLCEGENVPEAENRVQLDPEAMEVVERATDWDSVVRPVWFREYLKTIQFPRKLPDDLEDKLVSLWAGISKPLDVVDHKREK